MAWAVLLEFGLVVATGVALASVGLVIGPALLDPNAFAGPMLGILTAICGIELGQVAVAAIFLVGFHGLHTGRNEYGLSHAQSLDRARICLGVLVAVGLLNTALVVSASLFSPAVQTAAADSLLTGNVFVGPIEAFVAGLALLYSLRGIAEDAQIRRLRVALALGVVGAFAGPGLIAFEGATNANALSAVVTGLLAAAVAGEGVSALSLLLFFLVMRDVRRNLTAGQPAPALPRYDQVYPWSAVPSPYLMPQRPPLPQGAMPVAGPPSPSTRFCKTCGQWYPAQFFACPRDATPLTEIPPGRAACPKCGAAVQPTDIFCANCGFRGGA